MNGQVISKKAARNERRKAKVASMFSIDEQVMKKPTEEEDKMVETNEESSNEPLAKRPRLTDEEYALKEQWRLKKKFLLTLPSFNLTHCGLKASMSVTRDVRAPLSVYDIQTLIVYSLLGPQDSIHPDRWCQLLKWSRLAQTLVLAVDNVSATEFSENSNLFPETHKIFEDVVEIYNPRNDGYSLAPALAFIPVGSSILQKVIIAYGSLRKAAIDGFLFGPEDSLDNSVVKEKKSKTKWVVKSVENFNVKEPKKPCTRLELLLSPSQLLREGYPVPGIDKYKDYVFTKDEYAPVTETSPMFSIDCEWVMCVDASIGLARVAIVNEHLQTVYHTFVMPAKPIMHYLTKFSGITKEILRGVTTNLADVQRDIRNLLPANAIIVGQSVNFDLKALKMLHPYIIDSCIIYNLTGIDRFKTKLKDLTLVFCRRLIQNAVNDGHNPIEDALAAMELVLLKLENGLSYGDVRLGYGAYKTERETIKQTKKQKFDSGGDSCAASKTEGNEVDESELDHDGTLYIKLFSYLQCLNKEATLIISRPETSKIYRPKVIALNKHLIERCKSDTPTKPVRTLTAKDFSSIVQTVKDTRFDSNFTLIHTQIEKIEEETARKEKWKLLDKTISEIYNQIPPKGMMVVVFGGSEEDPTQNGACLVKINRPEIPTTF